MGCANAFASSIRLAAMACRSRTRRTASSYRRWCDRSCSAASIVPSRRAWPGAAFTFGWNVNPCARECGEMTQRCAWRRREANRITRGAAHVRGAKRGAVVAARLSDVGAVRLAAPCVASSLHAALPTASAAVARPCTACQAWHCQHGAPASSLPPRPTQWHRNRARFRHRRPHPQLQTLWRRACHGWSAPVTQASPGLAASC